MLVIFAFLAGRLLFQFEGPKRMTALLVCYAAPLVLLWLAHPGFLLNADLLMTLRSVVVLILISHVLVLLLGQISESISYLHRKELGVHEARVSMIDFVMNSFGLGLRVMRTRRFRTTLELVSIILIVVGLVFFTSLSSFALIGEALGVDTALYEGIMLHHEEWAYANRGGAPDSSFSRAGEWSGVTYSGLGVT